MTTSNAIQAFKGKDFSVRTIKDNETIWFVAKDIAEALEYKDSTINNAISSLFQSVPAIWADKKRIFVRSENGIEQERDVLCLTEQGVYFFLGRSDKKKALPYQMWIAGEVVPAIRKTGFYATSTKIDDILADPDSFISILQAYKTEKAKAQALSEQVAVQKQQIAELQPKANYYDIVLQCKDVLPISVISKDYGWTAIRMNAFLHTLGVQFKQGGIWLLYKEYAEMGYTSTKTSTYTDRNGEEHSKVHTYWTQKGRLFIYHQLKSVGYLPLIEQEGECKQ